MPEVITAEDLASYPGVVEDEDSESLALVVEMVNGLITDVIGTELDPIPFKVKAIALEAAARALRYAEGASSISKAIDDWKKTVRYEGPDGRFRSGIYLTDEELATLSGLLGHTGVGSIRLRMPWGFDAGDHY